MSQEDREFIEVGEESLTWDKVIKTVREATEISRVLHTLVQDDSFRDISPQDMDRLQNDIWNFAIASLKWELSWPLERYNLEEFDRDHEAGFDSHEFQNYMNALNLSFTAIVELDGKDKFSSVMESAYDMSTGEYQEWIQSWVRNKIESARREIWDITNIDQDYLEEIKKQNFDFPAWFLSKEFWIVLASESGWLVEDVVDLVVSLIPAIWRFPTYLELRDIRSTWDREQQVEAEIMIWELVEHNPALWIWEISMEDLEKLWILLKSGTNEWVVTWLISVVWVIVAWGGLLKIWSKVLNSRGTPDIPGERIEPTLSRPSNESDRVGTWDTSPDLSEVRQNYPVGLALDEMRRMDFRDRVSLVEGVFWRTFNLAEVTLIAKVNRIVGDRRTKMNAFLDETLSWEVFQNTLEIQYLFDAGIIRVD